MKLVKLYKVPCGGCESVSSFLNDKGITPDVEIDIFKDTDKAIKYGVMSVPVVVLEDDNGNEIQRSIGFKPAELEDIVSKLQ